MARFVRSSKYRHVFGKESKKEERYDDLQVSRSAWDSNKADANNRFVAVAWEARGGGSFAVIPHADFGKKNADLPLFNGHSGPVLDLAFHPFNDYIIASASEDCTAKLWQIPANGLTQSTGESVQNLLGHRRKVGGLRFNPVASNVLATASVDYLIKLWDVEKGADKNEISGHSDIIQGMEWNWNGSLLATSCKDKKVRVIDPRKGAVVQEVVAHQGVKGSRLTWVSDREWIFSVGFSKTSERQFSLWDPKNLAEPLFSQNIDTSSGVLIPFYDNDTGLLFLAGKGDGNIRYYEVVDEKPYVHYVSEYKSAKPQVGCAMYPKTAVNVNECEIVRLLKVTTTALEPVSFIVPRKSDIFQDDIYPPTRGTEPGLDAASWFAGKNGDVKKVSLQGGFTPSSKPVEFKADKKEQESGPATEKELRAEYEKLKARVAHLESELTKKDAQIAELRG